MDNELGGKTKEENLKKYIENLVNTRVLPFFKQYLTQMYDESINIVVDFKDGQVDVKIGADKNSEYIHYHISENIKDLRSIGTQLTTFQDVTGVELFHKTNIPREEIDTLFLIHEFAHKYHWNLMRNNNSYQELKDFKKEYYFRAVDILKKMSGKINVSNPSDLYLYVKDLVNGQSTNSELEEYANFFRQKIRGVPIFDVVFDYFKMDNSLGIDVDETFAKSVEKIYIENADLSEDVKNALLEYRQDWFENHPIVETRDTESKTSRTYQDEVFFRLYNAMGQDAFIECLKNANYFEIAKLRIRDAKTEEYSEEYKRFLQNPSEYMRAIGKDVTSNGLIPDIFQMMSSEQAKELGIDIGRYEVHHNPLLKSAVLATEEDVGTNQIQEGLDTIIGENQREDLTNSTPQILEVE